MKPLRQQLEEARRAAADALREAVDWAEENEGVYALDIKHMRKECEWPISVATFNNYNDWDNYPLITNLLSVLNTLNRIEKQMYDESMRAQHKTDA